MATALLPHRLGDRWIIGLNPAGLVTARKNAGLSQSGLADRAGYTKGYISQLERGVKTPSLNAVQVFATVLDVDLGVFCVTIPVTPNVEVSA